MPKISFAKKNRASLEVPAGANLMKSLLDASVPVASSCHSEGVCGKCRIRFVAGIENLSPIEDLEDFLLQKHDLGADFRISCQVQVLGDIEIDTGYW